MDKQNYINNIYKVSKYLQKYVNNNSDLYLQKINHYIEKTHANQHGGTMDEVQRLVQGLIDTVQQVIDEHKLLVQQQLQHKQPEQQPELPKVDLNTLLTIELIVKELIKQNPELIRLTDIMINNLGIARRHIRNESADEIRIYVDDLENDATEEERVLIFDELMKLKGRDSHPNDPITKVSAPQPVPQPVAPAPTPVALQPPTQAVLQPRVLKPLNEMTAADVAAEIAKLEDCRQYQEAWAKSDIYGMNVIGCDEEELNEYLFDIKNLGANEVNRKRILKHLMELKKEYEAQPQPQAQPQAQPLAQAASSGTTASKLLLSNPSPSAAVSSASGAAPAPPNFGRSLIVQAILIDPITKKKPIIDGNVSENVLLIHPLSEEDEQTITRKIEELFGNTVNGNASLNKHNESKNTVVVIFVNFNEGADMQAILEEFNINANAVITLHDGNMYRLYATYQTQRQETSEKPNSKYDKVNEDAKAEVNKRATKAFNASINPIPAKKGEGGQAAMSGEEATRGVGQPNRGGIGERGRGRGRGRGGRAAE